MHKQSFSFLLSTLLFTGIVQSQDIESRLISNLNPYAIEPKVSKFDLRDVKLLDGPFEHAQQANRRYMMEEVDLDLVLYPFYREAGLPIKKQGIDGFIYSSTGHYAGHYMTACALLYRNTGDEEIRKQGYDVVSELARCQAKFPNGYLAGFPERTMLDLAGLVDDPAVRYGVPWYCLHKIYQGLLDMYTLAGNQQALDVALKAADWAYDFLKTLDDAQMQKMLDTESGGINEFFANLYAVTGQRKYLDLSLRLNHRALLNPFAAGEARLTGLHANTQIPVFIGVARQWELSGEKPLDRMASLFWTNVTSERSYVTGGNSMYEYFSPPKHLSHYVRNATTETCNTYNMLKLTELLYAHDPKATCIDYYERALFNHILSTQNPENGWLIYFHPLQSGDGKFHPVHNGGGGKSNWSIPREALKCCYGTGLESHAKHAWNIYWREGDEKLFVNQFIASELSWKAKGITMRQQTSYPDYGSSVLTFSCAQPVALEVNVRCPAWCTQDFRILINGKNLPVTVGAGNYVTISRVWKDGDRVEITMPMTLRTEGFKDDPNVAAVMYGPLVMAATTEAGNRYSVAKTTTIDVARHLKPVPGKSLEFTASASVFCTSPFKNEGKPVLFRPLVRIFDTNYAVYWKFEDKGMSNGTVAALEQERKRMEDIEANTVDVVMCGLSDEFAKDWAYSFQGLLFNGKMPRKLAEVSEQQHDYNVGRGRMPEAVFIGTDIDELFIDGVYSGVATRFIPRKTWLIYRMKIVRDAPQTLQIRILRQHTNTLGGKFDQGSFDILANNEKIGECDANALPLNGFVDVTFTIPASLVKNRDFLTIRLVDKGGEGVRGLYELRILKK